MASVAGGRGAALLIMPQAWQLCMLPRSRDERERQAGGMADHGVEVAGSFVGRHADGRHLAREQDSGYQELHGREVLPNAAARARAEWNVARALAARRAPLLL
jgi:hypothetical protein